MRYKERLRGVGSMVLGCALLAGALVLTVHNLNEDKTAGLLAGDRLATLQTAIDENLTAEPERALSYSTAGTQPEGGTGNADSAAATPAPVATRVPEMATEEVEGDTYIGVLEIPAENMTLPVMAEWSYTKLNTAPCRYLGSYYSDNMVIAAHNFANHFRPLQHIAAGTDVYFVTVEGAVYHYVVDNVETLYGNEGDKLCEGEWDLTLFTCWPGGGSRCVVRCARV